MKTVATYILLFAVIFGFVPYSILAETTDIGVNIIGAVSIDVVTTISADITLDLTTGETTPTYMEIQNNSTVPVNVKITDISTTSEGAPSTFVGASDKDWLNLNRLETSTYVNFNILGEGQNVSPKDILADTELELTSLDVNGNTESTKTFEINANFGRNWDGNKNFIYQITMVYSRSNDYISDLEPLCILESETPLAVGAEYTCDLGDGDKTFYVLENNEESDNISLIYNQNIGDNNYFELYDYELGAANLDIAVDYVLEQTSTWTDKRIIEKTIPTAQQIASAAGLLSWNSGSETMTIPGSASWLYKNISSNSPYGYWTSTYYQDSTYGVWMVYNYNEALLMSGESDHHSVAGVRPVIVVEKTNMGL